MLLTAVARVPSSTRATRILGMLCLIPTVMRQRYHIYPGMTSYPMGLESALSILATRRLL